MPDLLSHALIAYSLATVASWRYDWVTRPYVTAAMAGAFIPDMAKTALIVPSTRVERFIGMPFDWFGLHTLGAAVCSVLIGVVLVSQHERRRVGLLLSLGSGSHLFADALLRKPTGLSYPLLWPLSRVYPPTPGLYLSTDVWPGLVLSVVAVIIWSVDKRRVPT